MKSRRSRRSSASRLPARFPDLLKGRVVASPDDVWASAIARLTWRGFPLYVCIVLDLDTRAVVGSSAGRKRASLPLHALMSVLRRDERRPAVFHSAPRAEYLEPALLELLAAKNIEVSNSRTLGRTENGIAESNLERILFEWSFKGHPSDYASPEDLVMSVMKAFLRYNVDRAHTALGMPPVEFYEKRMRAAGSDGSA